MKYIRVVVLVHIAVAMLFVPVLFAGAQTVTTPYWCGSYWSSYPCGSYNYNYSYVYNYPYMYPPYSYTYSYTYPYYSYYNYPYYSYPYRYPRPSCWITVTPSYSSSYYGYYSYFYLPAGLADNQPATLSWSSSNATSAYISQNVGAVSTSGSRTVYPSANTTYTMMVQGPGGSNTCQTTYYQQYYSYYPYQYYQQQYYYPYQYYQPYYRYPYSYPQYY